MTTTSSSRRIRRTRATTSSKDLVDRSFSSSSDANQIAPEKPWMMYLAFGATHAPHHAPKEWADKYKGKFDMGYEKYREIVLENMKKAGHGPGGHGASADQPVARAGGDLRGRSWCCPGTRCPTIRRSSSARMAEVYAGFASYTDHELGRLLDYLEESGQLDNTIIVVVSDNGASGEGDPERLRQREQVLQRLAGRPAGEPAKMDELGSPEHLQPLPHGLGMGVQHALQDVQALHARRRHRRPMHHRLAEGDTEGCRAGARPVSPRHRHRAHRPRLLRHRAAGRDQGLHAESDPGREHALHVRQPGRAETRAQTQYYAMLGTRAIYHNGWKAVARHGAISGKGHFMDDQWELYHIEQDRAEVHDLADQHPQKAEGDGRLLGRR